jgi:AraC family transcriptional regulator
MLTCMSVTAKALWYIESHMTNDLSLVSIAQDVGVSPYHLSRAFSTATGYGPASYIRARRLGKAARALLSGAEDILAVALDAGYGSHEAFTRAFKQHFGITPEHLRAQRVPAEFNLLEPIRMQPASTHPVAPVRVTKRDSMLVFGLSQQYQPQKMGGIPSQWEQFLTHFGNIPYQVGQIAYGVIYNSDDTGAFDYLCGTEVSEFSSQPAEFTRLRIPAQTYAVFLHTDHISGIAGTCCAIWNQGLPDSGHEAADGPWFELYDERFNSRTGVGIVEIWVPITR